MKTKINHLLGSVLSLLVLGAVAPTSHAQLVGRWTFDEGSGTQVIDSSGNGNHGLLVGAPAYSPDTPFGSGSSLLFANTPFPESASQYVKISNAANLPASALSIAAWVKIPTSRPDGAMVIVAKGGGGVTDSFVLYQNTSFGSPGAVFSFELAGGSSGGVGGPLIAEDGKWHHVAGAWADGSPARVYLDGVLVATSPSAFSGTLRYDSSFPISIGADFDPDAGLGWHGRIDDVRIYGHALSDAEVQEIVRGNCRTTELIVNGDFETGDFSGWTLNFTPPDDVAVINYFDLDRIYHGSYAVNFSYRAAFPSAVLSQTFNTVSGASHNVRFAFGIVAWDDRAASLRVEVIGANGTAVLASRTLTRQGNNPAGGGQVNPAEWTIESLPFIADGSSATLRFTDVTADGFACDALLDHVSIESCGGCPNASFAEDAIIWHQPLARSGASEDTDPSAGRTIKYRFKRGSTIPIQIHALNCAGTDVTSNANVIGKVTVFGDSNCDGAADANAEPIEFNGVGGAGGVMDKIGGHLKYNLDTKSLPTTTQCYILRVTVTDTSTGEEKFEEVLLQAK